MVFRDQSNEMYNQTRAKEVFMVAITYYKIKFVFHSGIEGNARTIRRVDPAIKTRAFESVNNINKNSEDGIWKGNWAKLIFS